MLVIALGAALAFGFCSALVPILNAEAYLAAAALVGTSSQLLICAAGLAVGQTCGKIVLFEGSTKGFRRWGARQPTKPRFRWPQWLTSMSNRLMTMLGSSRSGAVVVLISASVGLPPLALVSIAAGKAETPRWSFVVPCLVGRCVRFFLLAWPLMVVTE